MKTNLLILIIEFLMPDNSPQPDSKSKLTLLKKNYKKIAFGAAGVFVLVAIAGVVLLLVSQQNATTNPNYTNDPTDGLVASLREPFASVKLEQIAVTSQVPKYNLGADFANVVNFKRFEFNSKTKADLGANKFAVVQRDESASSVARDEFFDTYENNRYQQIPSFITTDAVMHNYHLVFDDTLKTLETTVFSDKTIASAKQMYAISQQQYTDFSKLNSTPLTQAATRNVAYFAIALKLLGQDVKVPTYASKAVDQEMALIKAAKSMTASPIINLFSSESPENQFQEDYTQYIPRGHYTTSEKLKKYFQGMMWLGRITFRQKNDSENLSALLIVQAVNSDKTALSNWKDVYDAIGFIVGNSDDLGIYEYTKIATDTFKTLDNQNIADDTLQKTFLDQIKKLSSPKINSIPIYDESINPDRDAQIKGFRFMGQRYTIDADVFQNLIYRSVKENSKNERRMLPSSLDLMAAMGSQTAEKILETQGAKDFQNYTANLQKLQTTISSFPEATWTSNLYNGWLYTIKALLTPLSGDVPDFMQNTAWTKKDMNTYQGSWTELKHDTLLYTKQSYAEAGAGGNKPLDLDFRGYVEPNYVLYSRLQTLTTALEEGLNSRKLLEGKKVTYTEDDPACPTSVPKDMCKLVMVFDPAVVKANIQAMKDMSNTLKTISIKELENKALSDSENNFIKEFGAELEHTWEASLHKATPLNLSEKYENLNKNPAMLVADVATDPNGSVLEEGTGRLMDIYVIIPAPGSDGTYLRVAHGLVFSQYEFVQPAASRLTDAQWQAKVRAGDVPAFASWKDFIIPKTNVNTKAEPVTYKDALDQGWMTTADAQKDCSEYRHGTFVQCGNVCPENNLKCGKACEPICKTY